MRPEPLLFLVAVLSLFLYSSLARAEATNLYGLQPEVAERWDAALIEGVKSPQESVEWLQELIAALPDRSVNERLYAEMALVDLLLSLEQASEARKMLTGLEEKVRDTGLPAFSYRLHYLHAGLLLIEAKTEGALQQINQALNLISKLDAPEETAAARYLRAQIYSAQQRYKKALEDFLYCYHFYKSERDNLRLSATVAAMAQIYSTTEKHRQAIHYYKEALQFLEDTDQQHYLSIIEFSIGIAHMNTDDYEQAEKHLTRALSLSEELNDEIGMAHAWKSLGKLRQAQRQHELAIANFKKALPIAHSYKDKGMTKKVLGRLAKSHLQTGQLEEAKSFIEEALLIQSSELDTDIAWLYKVAAEIYEESGDLRAALQQQEAYHRLVTLKHQSDITGLRNEYQRELSEKSGEYQRRLKVKDQALNDAHLEKDKTEKRLENAIAAVIALTVALLAYILINQIRKRPRE